MGNLLKNVMGHFSRWWGSVKIVPKIDPNIHKGQGEALPLDTVMVTWATTFKTNQEV
jgi:hypothetical protein